MGRKEIRLLMYGLAATFATLSIGFLISDGPSWIWKPGLTFMILAIMCLSTGMMFNETDS